MEFDVSATATLCILPRFKDAVHDWTELSSAQAEGGTFTVEHRYIGTIVGGNLNDKLEIQ